ncbi:contactin-associated protein-like 2 [Argopecten irradians]|uniref:contactin-associated protein-like 2 n=1 Tax=Argopecten irradians TaxID=31199 RepID=UPI003724AB99
MTGLVIQTLGFISIVVIIGRARAHHCNFNLVTGPHGVSDDALSASSTYKSCYLEDGRINSSDGWCPNNTDNGNYFQVEFKEISSLRAIQTRGRQIFTQWVTMYSVNTSLDGLTWTAILNSTTGDVKSFPGNFDGDTIVTNNLEGNVMAKYIRVISISGYASTRRSMRLEVLGCPISFLSDTCQTCKGWKARLGSTGDVLKVLEEMVASNHGMCGLRCFRQPDCDSFFFDVGNNHCRLLNSTLDGSSPSVHLDGVWYFIKNTNVDF